MAEPGDVKPWFREDLAKVLVGIKAANRMGRNGAELDDKQEGFLCALSAVAMTIGIPLSAVFTPWEIDVITGSIYG